jgi:hypothetical protein
LRVVLFTADPTPKLAGVKQDSTDWVAGAVVSPVPTAMTVAAIR